MTGLHARPRRGAEETIPFEPAGTPLPPLPPMVKPAALADPEADRSTTPISAVITEPAQPCRCDQHKYGQPRPGSGVLLYAGPGGEDLRWNMHIREGWYEDVCAFDGDAWGRIHDPAIATAERIRRDIEIGYLRARSVAAAGRPS
jgi:hypothetical protein